MLFLPYKMDSQKNGIPLFTVLICFACAFIYWKQFTADNRYYAAVDNFCHSQIDKRTISLIRHITHLESGNQCRPLLESIRNANSAEKEIHRLAKQAKPIGIFASKDDDFEHIYNGLFEIYQQFEVKVPKLLTGELAYDPNNLDVGRMITSTFSHASTFHLLGNLLFFYIFAASVELIAGSLMYAAFIAITTIGTSLAYSYAMFGVETALPTVGLSGVVMAAVAALAIMMPRTNIRCLFWFLFYIKIFRIPALFLALWYIGWDIYEMNQLGSHSYVNYVAHVSGAGIGALFGIYHLIFRKALIEEAAISY
jgi:membrane associated rhomboid family serine protease